MSEKENVQFIKDAYAAWLQGDLDTVFSTYTQDVEWWFGGPPEIIPFAGPRQGHSQMREFFAKLNEVIEFEEYEIQDYIAQDNKVIALGRSKVRVRSTGQQFEDHWSELFELREGKIARMIYYNDTGRFVEALQAK